MKRFWILLLPVFFLMAAITSCGPKDNLEREATAIINSKCKKCHSLKKVYNNKGKEAQWWDETLNRMRNYGADLSDEESLLLRDYLSRR